MFQRSRFPFRSLWLLPILPAILALIYGLGPAATARAADGPPPFPPPTPTGTIIVIKDTQPDDPQDFSYNLYYYQPSFGLQAQFSLDDDGTDLNPLSNTYQTTVTAGKYSVSEAGTAGWELDSLVCVSTNPLRVFPGLSYDPNNNGTGIAFDIDAGETITCTFTNSLIMADLTIVKETDPDGGTGFPFTIDTGVYAYESQFGSSGMAEGQFANPVDVATDGAGKSYVVDNNRARVQIFNPDGTFKEMWGWGVDDGTAEFQICTSGCQEGIIGNGDGQFGFGAGGIAVDAAGNVIVVSEIGAGFGPGTIQKLDSSGVFLWKKIVQGPAEGQFFVPIGVDVDAAGNIYVADSGNYRIQVFDTDGNFLRMWGKNVDPAGGTGAEICTSGCQAGAVGTAEGEFNKLEDVAVDSAGNVWVVDKDNRRVQKFDGNGNFLLMVGWGVDDGTAALQVCTSGCQAGIIGNGAGQFNLPRGATVDAGDNVYVSDYFAHRIQVFSSAGAYLGVIGTAGSGDGEFSGPFGLEIDGSGKLYVADSGNNRVQVFSTITEFTLDDDQSEPFVLASGTYTVTELVPGGWTLTGIDCDGGDPGLSGDSVQVTLLAGDDVTCTFTNGLVPEPPTAEVYMSTRTAGTTGDGLDYGSEDIIKWDGSAWSMWFDGSAAGLTPTGNARHDINAFWISDLGLDHFLLSFTQNRRTVPGITPKVDGMDLVRWAGSEFSFWFDGSDVGLTNKTQEKIDGLHVLPGGESPIGAGCLSYLLISTQGPGKVPNHSGGTLKFGGEDVLGFCATSLGENTAGLWHMVLDGSAEGMPRNSTDSISVSADGQTMYLTTQGTFNVDAAAGGHSMVYAYDFGTGTFSGPIFSAPAEGLPSKVDGLQLN